MEIEYRKVNRNNPEEMNFIALEDSKIPLLYDPEYIWNESSTPTRLNFYKQLIADDDYFEVAVFQNKLIGFHIVKKVPYPPDIFIGDIITLWVSPAFRGKGLATSLKLRAEKWARDLGIAYLQTEVHSSNSQMLSINKNNGFSISQYTLRKKL